jgi:hypothetical protein
MRRSPDQTTDSKKRNQAMMEELRDRKSKLSHEWIKGPSGVSYLCPTGSVEDKSSATDDDLKAVCVEESANPQND